MGQAVWQTCASWAMRRYECACYWLFLDSDNHAQSRLLGLASTEFCLFSLVSRDRGLGRYVGASSVAWRNKNSFTSFGNVQLTPGHCNEPSVVAGCTQLRDLDR